MIQKQIPLIVSIGAGILAVVLFQIYMKKERAELFNAGVPVVVASVNSDLPAGTPLEEAFLEKKPVPKRFLHEKAVLFSDASQVIGQPLRYPVKSGEVLLWTGISGKRENTLATLLIKGKRALTLGVDELTSVSGLIQPGDHVDILGTFFAGGLAKEGVDLKLGEATVMLLQNVLVLATGTQMHLHNGGNFEERGSFSAITVAATPEEAGLLVLSQNRGRLTMILRQYGDQEIISNLPKITYDDIKLGKDLHYLLKDRNQRIIEIPPQGQGKRK
jgi:pilus assembly protein CpaB